jgi:hypothetical protein
MNKGNRIALVLALALLGVVALVGMTWAATGNTSLALRRAHPNQGGAPTVVAYQGEVRVSGEPYSGDGYFKFAVINAAGDTSYWSNDGTSTVGDPPDSSVTLTVGDGLFGVPLGDTSLGGGMTQELTAEVFDQPDRYLRVWFSTDAGGPFDQLTPDTRVAAVPYALQAEQAANADTVDGLHADELRTHYGNVVVVAKSGGDYTGVQSAIDGIADAAADNPYLVWVAPGVYSETVTMKPFVHLQGAGREATVITSTASYSGNWPPTQATLILASDASLRDLTVGNGGVGETNVALLATVGVTRTLVAEVTARAVGGGENDTAIFLSGSGTSVTLQRVDALAENGSNLNAGLTNFSRAATVLNGGIYTARGGTNAWAIFNVLTATLEATGVTALGEYGSNLNSGLNNYNNSTAVLYGGDYTGRGGNQTGGAGASHHSTITATGVTAVAEYGNGDVGNYALGCYDNSTATLNGGVFIARGGVNNYALSNELTATMKAVNVTSLAENGSDGNYGFWNVNNATAVVHNASFTARGGTSAIGIDAHGTGTTLEAEGITALGQDGSTSNLGLFVSEAAATLRGGSFTARGGATAFGILNLSSNATLEADDTTVLAENSSTSNFGLYNFDGAKATLRGGSFTGRGGDSTRGIENAQNGSVLTAENVTALAENSSNENYGLGSFDNVTTTVRGGSFTARGGTATYGIANELTATLTAEYVTALGENGSSSNNGLWNHNNAKLALHGASLTGRGGISAYGINNHGSGTTLEAESVTARGENSSGDSYGLNNDESATADLSRSLLAGATNSIYHDDTGSVVVSNGRLGGNPVSGTVICVLVTRGTIVSTDGTTCP